MGMKYWLSAIVLVVVAGCDGSSNTTVDGVFDNASEDTITESGETSAESENNSSDSSEVTSQDALVAKYAGATFVSAEQLEVGETANGGLAMGHWTVSFTADTVTWAYSDVVEVGTYSYVDGVKPVANFSGREIAFSGDGVSVTWDSRQYLRTATSVFDSQQSLVSYFDGTKYNSVEELDLGENASGGLAMGNWSADFNGDEVTLLIQDTVQVGTYSYVGGSSFRISFFNSDITAYVLYDNQLIINSVVYEKDYSGLFDSQESLVAFLDGTSYKSAGLQQLGESNDGVVAIGHWIIDFSADTFSWFYQDVAEAGTIVYLADNSFTAVFANRELTVDLQRGDILWDGVRYIKE